MQTVNEIKNYVIKLSEWKEMKENKIILEIKNTL
jgi:hypothetical protein